jgi:hypothetical protein
VVAGYYADTKGVGHGFLRAPDGTLTSFATYAVSSQRPPLQGEQVVPLSINVKRTIAGYYNGLYGFRGFVRSSDGNISTFDVSGAVPTIAASINGSGVVAGYYEDHTEFYHAYIRDAGGAIATFDVPGASDSYAVTINDQGMVAGSYSGSDGLSHGFLRIP